MEAIPGMEKLDMSFRSDDTGWRDEDLDEILALLGEAPPAPKLPPEPEEVPEPQELPDEEELFDRSSWNASGEEKTERQPMALPNLRNLIPEEEDTAEKIAAAFAANVALKEEPEEANDALEAFPIIPRQFAMSEEPAFDEKPPKPRKPWVLAVLALTAVAEIGALVGILIWWQQWIA